MLGTITFLSAESGRIYSDDDVREWVEEAGAEYREIESIHGHDAFLIEVDQVAAIVTDALENAVVPARV